jgi:hypothetical protein
MDRLSFPLRVVAVAFVAIVVFGTAEAQAGKSSSRTKPAEASCRRVVFEGDVKAGEAYDKVFAKGLRFYLEPLLSGWIVRVLAADEPRGPHDYAELATPPYRSVSPLLLSTDWSFRAQDAIAWNPRRFRYVGDRGTFQKLAALYPGVMANDPASSAKAAMLASTQPEAVMKVLDARIVPGLADQARMASMVAGHLAETPHTVDQSVAPSPLGRMEELRFRIEMILPRGVMPAPGVEIEKISCAPPTS